MAPPSTAVHLRQQTSRADNLVKTLAATNSDLLGLPPNQLHELSTYLQSELDDSVLNTSHRADAATTHDDMHMPTTTSALEKRLFPSMKHTDAADRAAEIVSDAMRHKQARRKFSSWKEFQRKMGPFMQRLITEDPERFKAYYKYEHFLVSLLDNMGWEAAEAYHWLLFERIEDGEFDLVTDGPYDAASSTLLLTTKSSYTCVARASASEQHPRPADSVSPNAAAAHDDPIGRRPSPTTASIMGTSPI